MCVNTNHLEGTDDEVKLSLSEKAVEKARQAEVPLK